MRRKDCCCSLSTNARKEEIGLGWKMQAFGMEQAITFPKILPIVDQVSDIVSNFIATLIPYFCFNYTIGEACKLKFRWKLKPLGTPNDALRHYSFPLFGFSDSATQTSDVIVADASTSTSEEHIDICQNVLLHCFRSWHIVSKSVYCRPSLTTAVQVNSHVQRITFSTVYRGCNIYTAIINEMC